MNINDYKDILHRVYDLATIEGAKVRAEVQDGPVHIDEEFLKRIVEERQNSDLFQYLNTLDATTVRIVMTVMYIGRDYSRATIELDDECNGAEADREKEYPVQNPSEEVQHYMDYINSTDSKEIEINQIFEKRMKLDEYMKRGLWILGLE